MFMFSFTAPLVMATYQLFDNRAQEERLYDGRTNPSPLIDLIEQDMAMRAEGEVHVYIDYERDITALKRVIKVRYIWNSNITSNTLRNI